MTRRSLLDGSIRLTDDDYKNGWDEPSLFAYIQARDAAAGLVAGNVVTKFERPRPPIRVETALSCDPHRHWKRS